MSTSEDSISEHSVQFTSPRLPRAKGPRLTVIRVGLSPPACIDQLGPVATAQLHEDHGLSIVKGFFALVSCDAHVHFRGKIYLASLPLRHLIMGTSVENCSDFGSMSCRSAPRQCASAERAGYQMCRSSKPYSILNQSDGPRCFAVDRREVSLLGRQHRLHRAHDRNGLIQWHEGTLQ